MGDLDLDTRLTGADGCFTSTPSNAWEIWGPMGGYIASIALRAAATEAPAGCVPASFTCQFFSPARFEPVDLVVTPRRVTKRTAAIAVAITQQGRAILDAQAWFTVENEVVTHDFVAKHRHGHPDNFRHIRELTDEEPRFQFWYNFDSKPTVWIDDFESYEGGQPEWSEWLRFLPTATFADPVLEACRLLILADLPSFPAANRAYAFGALPPWMAPSLDLAVQFHRLDDLGEWLLCDGTAPIAERGLLAFRSEVWTADGRVAASGSGQLLSRWVDPPG